MESAAERKARLKALREAAQQGGGEEGAADQQGTANEPEQPAQEPVLKFRWVGLWALLTHWTWLYALLGAPVEGACLRIRSLRLCIQARFPAAPCLPACVQELCSEGREDRLPKGKCRLPSVLVAVWEELWKECELRECSAQGIRPALTTMEPLAPALQVDAAQPPEFQPVQVDPDAVLGGDTEVRRAGQGCVPGP